MKITSKTMKDILLAVSEAFEPKDMGKIIFPLIDAIETLQSTLEIVAEERKDYEKEAKGLKKRIEQSEKNNEDTWDRVYKIRDIIESIDIVIPVEKLYGKIKEIGDLLNSDLSKQIEFIKTVKEELRQRQDEIITLRGEKEKIEIQWVQIQKENEALTEGIKKVEDTNAILHGRIMTEENENKTLKEQISKLEDTNRKLSGELLNQNEEIHMFEEEIDRLKSANEDLKRLNRQIQENVK